MFPLPLRNFVVPWRLWVLREKIPAYSIRPECNRVAGCQHTYSLLYCSTVWRWGQWGTIISQIDQDSRVHRLNRSAMHSVNPIA